MNALLAAIFNFFKTKSPKLYAVFVAVVGVVLVLDGQGFVSVPQWIEDILIAVGLVAGVHTKQILDEEKRNS